jgi:hypothetical protein
MFVPGDGGMRTFQLRLIGETDGVVYGVKEYEASNEAHAAEVANGLCGDDPDLWWGGQRLLKELVPSSGVSGLPA